MIAKYNGHCRYETDTKCGGIKKGQGVTHKGRGNTFHPQCANKTPDENDRAMYEGAMLGQDQGKDLTIEFSDEYKWWSLYEFGVFERTSVLAGQTMKTFKDKYDTLEEAQKANPTAKVGYRDPMNTFNHLPDWDMSAREEEFWFNGEDY